VFDVVSLGVQMMWFLHWFRWCGFFGGSKDEVSSLVQMIWFLQWFKA
jgi:hypothetical protein